MRAVCPGELQFPLHMIDDEMHVIVFRLASGQPQRRRETSSAGTDGEGYRVGVRYNSGTSPELFGEPSLVRAAPRHP